MEESSSRKQKRTPDSHNTETEHNMFKSKKKKKEESPSKVSSNVNSNANNSNNNNNENEFDKKAPQKGSIGYDFGELLKSEQHFDVTFIVGSSKEKIEAHRLVLATRSKVFRSMLFGSMKESNTKIEIPIPDVEKSIFKKMLRFMYTDSVDITPDDVLPILYCAKKYDLGGLTEACLEFFNNEENADSWDEESIFVILEHASLFEEMALMDKAMKFIGTHAEEILSSSRMMTVPSDLLKRMVMSSALAVSSEMVVIEACLKWAEHECKRNDIPITPENRRKVLVDILPHLRFPTITMEELSSVIRPAGILTSDELLDLYEYVQLGKSKPKSPSFFPTEPRHSKCLAIVPLPAGPRKWHMLMKAGPGQTFDYNSQHWTTTSLLNEKDRTTEFKDAKFDAFNRMEIEELFIVAENKRFVHLKLPKRRTLLSCFQDRQTIGLQHLGGSRTPTILAGNDANLQYYDPVWRIQSTSNYNAHMRIGGWFYASWGQYGNDQANYQCSAEWAGLGLLDQAWSPFQFASKSFGIRTAHDGTGHGGNCTIGVIVYGR